MRVAWPSPSASTRSARAQRRGHEAVRALEGRQGAHGARRILHAGRPLAREVALRDVDVGLVERAPPVDEIAERRARAPREGGERRRRALPVPAAARRDPGRQREVVERHHRRDARGAQAREHLAVARGGRLVPGALGGLEAAPLDAQAVHVGAELPERRDVVAPQVPRVGGARGVRAARDVRRAVGIAAGLPRRPVVARAALDLVRRRRGAEEEAARRALEHVVRRDLGGREGDGLVAADAHEGERREREPSAGGEVAPHSGASYAKLTPWPIRRTNAIARAPPLRRGALLGLHHVPAGLRRGRPGRVHVLAVHSRAARARGPREARGRLGPEVRQVQGRRARDRPAPVVGRLPGDRPAGRGLAAHRGRVLRHRSRGHAARQGRQGARQDHQPDLGDARGRAALAARGRREGRPSRCRACRRASRSPSRSRCPTSRPPTRAAPTSRSTARRSRSRARRRARARAPGPVDTDKLLK